MWLLLEYELVLTDFRKRHGCDALDFRLARLIEQGNRCGPPISEHLDDGIFELRVRAREGHLRIYYFFGPNLRQITALHTVVKKRPKADPKDIRLAKQRRARILQLRVTPNVHAFDS
jgi:phage-related protein